MGLFSWFTSKTQARLAPLAATTEASPPAPAPAPAFARAEAVAQVRLRLRLAAALRTGEHDAAYDAASRLADFQENAGRRIPARTWRKEAARILALQDR